MSYLIEIRGSAKGCIVTPVIPHEFSIRKGSETHINLNALSEAGFDGFLSLSASSGFSMVAIASGMKVAVQVEKPYPWTKHTMTSNVPVESWCRRGYFKSVLLLIKAKIKSALCH